MTIAEISNVCFVGAGTMGCYNAIVAAISGYDTTLYDIDADALRQAPGRMEEFAGFLAANNYCPAEAVPSALDRISLSADLEQATARADLVSESIIERLDIKRDMHRRLEAACPDHTIITTNTSALLVSDIEDALQHGERFAALHSHLGAPLVDIVGGPRTSAATIDTLQRYVSSLGGVPLVLRKEHRGYVLNAMLGPLLSTGMLLVSRGDATLQEVDRAWMKQRNAPMGPFAMMDLFGLNLIHDSWHYRDDDGSGLRDAVLALLQPYLDRGELGMKAGRGFYSYPDPAYQQAGFLHDDDNTADIYAALVSAWVSSAIALAAQGVATPDDIDMAWRVGTHLDSGPLETLGQIGRAAFRDMLEHQAAAQRVDPGQSPLVVAWLENSLAAEPTL
jgi:3-hydroxybutyryl-CoA dehydrogenase